jgi:hypothetical protein
MSDSAGGLSIATNSSNSNNNATNSSSEEPLASPSSPRSPNRSSRNRSNSANSEFSSPAITTPDLTPNGKQRRGSLTDYKPRPPPQPSLPPPVLVRRTSVTSRRNEKKADFPRRSSQATPVTIAPRSLSISSVGEAASLSTAATILPRDTPDPQPKKGSLNRHSRNTPKTKPGSEFNYNNSVSKGSLNKGADKNKKSILSQTWDEEDYSDSQIVSKRGSISALDGNELKQSDSSPESSDEESKKKDKKENNEKESKQALKEAYTDDLQLDTLAKDIEYLMKGVNVQRIPHSRWGAVKTKIFYLENLATEYNSGGSSGSSRRRNSLNKMDWNQFCIRWQASKKDASRTMLMLDDSIELYSGQTTGRWALKSNQQKYADAADRSFTVLRSGDASLDLMCDTKGDFEKWIRVLKWLCKGDKMREINLKKYTQMKQTKAMQQPNSPTSPNSPKGQVSSPRSGGAFHEM